MCTQRTLLSLWHVCVLKSSENQFTGWNSNEIDTTQTRKLPPPKFSRNFSIKEPQTQLLWIAILVFHNTTSKNFTSLLQTRRGYLTDSGKLVNFKPKLSILAIQAKLYCSLHGTHMAYLRKKLKSLNFLNTHKHDRLDQNSLLQTSFMGAEDNWMFDSEFRCIYFLR